MSMVRDGKILTNRIIISLYFLTDFGNGLHKKGINSIFRLNIKRACYCYDSLFVLI